MGTDPTRLEQHRLHGALRDEVDFLRRKQQRKGVEYRIKEGGRECMVGRAGFPTAPYGPLRVLCSPPHHPRWHRVVHGHQLARVTAVARHAVPDVARWRRIWG